jgi:hypothetical protein
MEHKLVLLLECWLANMPVGLLLPWVSRRSEQRPLSSMCTIPPILT